MTITANDYAGNALSATSMFLANRWTVLESPSYNINHGEATPGEIDLNTGKRKWYFPSVIVTAESYPVQVSGSLMAGWGAIPLLTDLRGTSVRYKVAGQESSVFAVSATAAVVDWQEGMMFGQQVALIDHPQNLTGVTATVSRATVDLGTVIAQLPIEGESPSLSFDYTATYLYPPYENFHTLQAQSCLPNIPCPFNMPVADWLIAAVSDDEASTMALYDNLAQVNLPACAANGSLEDQVCKRVVGASIVFPAVLDTLGTAAPGWVEAGWLAWWRSGVRDLLGNAGIPPPERPPSPGDLVQCNPANRTCMFPNESASAAAQDPAVKATVQSWIDGLCRTWYCETSEAKSGWADFQDVFETPTSTEESSTCVYNGVETDPKRCKQLVKLRVGDYVRTQSDGRDHTFWVYAVKTRGMLDAPSSGREEDLGIRWSTTSDSSRYPQEWYQGSPFPYLLAIREKLYRYPNGNCYKRFDRNETFNVTDWTDENGQPVQIGWEWPAPGNRGDGRILKFHPGFYRNETVPTNHCANVPNGTQLAYQYRVAVATVSLNVQASIDWVAEGPPVYGFFIHRWKPWSQYACNGALKTGAFAYFSKRANAAIAIASLLINCPNLFDDKNWLYEVGPAKGRV